MNTEELKKFQQLWQEVVEKKKLDPVDDKELKGKHSDRTDKDIDNDGDADSSDEYLHKRRKAIKHAQKEEKEEKEDDIEQDMDKDGMKKCTECGGSTENHKPDCSKRDSTDKKKMSEDDVDNKSATKALKHDCATHVASEQWGYGECIPGEHTLVEQEDGTAIVTHYDVMFEHGVEFDVPVEDLTIVAEKSHLHASKKKVKEGKTHAERSKGATKPERMIDKYKGKAAKDMAKDHDMENPAIDDTETKGYDDASKAGRVIKNQSPTRGDEKRVGDLKVVRRK
jgi:hypothetical protein